MMEVKGSGGMACVLRGRGKWALTASVGRSVGRLGWLVGRSLARRPPLYTYHSFLEMTEPSVCEIMSSAISCSGSYWKARVRSSYSRLSPSSTVK